MRETLYWPRHACGMAGGGRASADAWMIDLLRHGLAIDAQMAFTVEEVLDRFRLCIYHDGGFRTDPPQVPAWDFATFVSDQGDTADSLDGLIAACAPGEYLCRVVNRLTPEHYRLTDIGLEQVGGNRGGNNRNRLDRFDN